MNKLKILFSVLLISLACCSYAMTRNFMVQQDTSNVKASIRVNTLIANKNFKGLISFCEKEIENLLSQPKTDSLEIAQLYQYQGKAHYNLMNYLECVKSDEAGLRYCNNTEEGRLLKGRLYSDKASAENYLHRSKSMFNSTLNAIKYLKSANEPDFDYIITSYRFLSEQCAYQGNTLEAKMYLRRAERLYEENKRHIDSTLKNLDGTVFRYDIVLLYSKIYQLYRYGINKQDSLEIVNSVRKFEDIVNAPDFDVENNGIYYTTALNHVGDWYASRKPEAQTTAKDIETALRYLNKSIHLVDKQGYPGLNLSTKYNKVKALALANKLIEAEELITELLETLSQADGRRPYFLAQKGLIKAKQQQKDSTVRLFYNAISKVHSDTVSLAEDLKNFKPGKTFGHTKLILRIAEELNRYFPEDSIAKRTVYRLYPLALSQFENSYDDRKFNKTYQSILRQIVKGILKSKKFGYNQDLGDDFILNKIENIEHMLAWQKFNMHRQINSFPDLDSIQLKTYELRNLMAKAKAKNDIHLMDSLKVQLDQAEKYTNENFPNLKLFTEEQFNLKEFQQQIGKNKIVLKYLELEDEIAIFQISEDHLTVDLKPWSTADAKDLNQFINFLTKKDYNLNLAKKLAFKLLPNLDPSVEAITISPDKIFSKLPFEVLNINDRLLVEQYQINYTSHLGFAKPKLSASVHPYDLGVYAPEYPSKKVQNALRSSSVDLKGALKESQFISGLFNSELHTGNTLTKTNFIETASNYKILHLAMHAELDDYESGISRLLFSDESSEEDDLFLEELYGLNLNADMAVLSACNTGIDKSNATSDIKSFQRAFTFAGIPSTVASLWEVPDSSTENIMIDFYKNLKSGQSKSEALKNAKINFVNTHRGTKLEQPYYWAGFVVYGDDSPVVESSDSWIWFVVGFLSIGGILLLINFLKKENKK